jgi:hypothetical protein
MAAMKVFVGRKIAARTIKSQSAKPDGVWPFHCVCGDERRSPQMLNERELLRRLRSIRAALGPALADEAVRRAAAAMARTVHEFAEHRTTKTKSGAGAAANLSNDAAKIGESPTAEAEGLRTVSRHEEIP